MNEILVVNAEGFAHWWSTEAMN